MAKATITMTKVADTRAFSKDGLSEIEYSITFGSSITNVYPTTGGFLFGFGSATAFDTKVRQFIQTKPPIKAGILAFAVPYFGASYTAAAAGVKLWVPVQTVSNQFRIKTAEMSNTTAVGGTTMRAIIRGY